MDMTASGTRETILDLFRQAPGRLPVRGAVERHCSACRAPRSGSRSNSCASSATGSRRCRRGATSCCASPDLPLAEELRTGLATAHRRSRDPLPGRAPIRPTGRPVPWARPAQTEGLVVIADRQSAGKGRLGRTWCSPPGVNLYLSVLLRPPLPPQAAPQLTFLSALAVSRAIVAVSGLDADPQVAERRPARRQQGGRTAQRNECGVRPDPLCRAWDRRQSQHDGRPVSRTSCALPRPRCCWPGAGRLSRAAFGRVLLEQLETLVCRVPAARAGPAPRGLGSPLRPGRQAGRRR